MLLAALFVLAALASLREIILESVDDASDAMLDQGFLCSGAMISS
jgi:hypothetical protein